MNQPINQIYLSESVVKKLRELCDELKKHSDKMAELIEKLDKLGAMQ
jgi:hypothetical protein